MPLHYGLIPNSLSENPDDFKGLVTDAKTITEADIIHKMIDKGSTVTMAEALSVIEEFEYAVVEAIKNGDRVSTKLFRINPTISGLFTSLEDGFDSSRHTVKLNLKAGSRLNAAIPEIKLKKVSISTKNSVLKLFIDLKSNLTNESFISGQIASIQGSNLKFNASDPIQGIYFIASDGVETKVTNIVKNKPSELQFFVPNELNRGTFQIELRTIFHHAKNLKKARLPHSLVALQ